VILLTRAIPERIRGGYDDAPYKSKFAYITCFALLYHCLRMWLHVFCQLHAFFMFKCLSRDDTNLHFRIDIHPYWIGTKIGLVRTLAIMCVCSGNDDDPSYDPFYAVTMNNRIGAFTHYQWKIHKVCTGHSLKLYYHSMMQLSINK